MIERKNMKRKKEWIKITTKEISDPGRK